MTCPSPNTNSQTSPPNPSPETLTTAAARLIIGQTILSLRQMGTTLQVIAADPHLLKRSNPDQREVLLELVEKLGLHVDDILDVLEEGSVDPD